MDIIRQQRDDVDANLWHFKIGGIAADGPYRLADLSRETTSPADWLAANEAEAQVLVDAGHIREEFNERRDRVQSFVEAAQNELDWLDTAISAWPTATNAQKLEAGERLMRQNRAIIKAVLYLARRVG